MIWQDLVVPRHSPNDRIVAALAAALEVDIRKVTVSDSIEDFHDQAVFCLRLDIDTGPFGSVLTISLATQPANSDAAIATIAMVLQASVLVADDETVDPYAMRLFAPGAPPRAVRMVVAELDEDRYLIDDGHGSAGAINFSPPSPVHAPGSCPASGYWMTPALCDSRRRFEYGEAMPVVDGDYGATIWQWDEQQ